MKNPLKHWVKVVLNQFYGYVFFEDGTYFQVSKEEL
jgi:hypothetical protein